MPARVTTKPARMRVRCARRFAKRSAAERRGEQAGRHRREDHAGLDRVVAAHHLQVGRHHERHAHQQQPLDVLRDEAEVGRPVAEQAVDNSGSWPARSLRPNGQEEPHQHERTGDDQAEHEPGCRRPRGCPSRRGRGRRPRAPRRATSNGRVGICRQRILHLAAQPDDHRDDERLEDEGGSPTDRGGDEATDQRARRGADPAERADRPERAGARGELGEQQRGQDVDRRDQQRGADTLEDRVAEDEDTRAQERRRSSVPRCRTRPDRRGNSAFARTCRSACRPGSSAPP